MKRLKGGGCRAAAGSICYVCCLLGIFALGEHLPYERQTYDTPDIPGNWHRGLRADPNHHIALHFLLRQQNVHVLARHLEEISDPASKLYGRHLSRKQVDELVSPVPEAAPAVQSFLRNFSATVSASTPNKDMIEFNMTIGAAERALGCEFFVYTRITDGATAHRTAGYSLPHSIAGYVHAVAPTVMLHSSPTPKKVSESPYIYANTPRNLRALYKVGSDQGDPQRATGNKQAVLGFLGQRYSQGDYHAFQNRFLTKGALGYTLSTKEFTLRGDGPRTAIFGGQEAMLDAEYIASMGASIASEFWGFSGADDPPQKLWLKWLALAARTSDAEIPNVFSVSYGEDEAYMASDFAARIDVEFMKLGACGVSILVSSGDSGATGIDKNTTGCPGNKFVPKWPPTSPYVTAVGGADYVNDPSQLETAASLSSGGFSSRFPQPKWQETAVSAYLGSANLTSQLKAHISNPGGRAFPDIAAQASASIVSSRFTRHVFGTSCSCPIVAGLVSLINDRRMASGKSPLGFLNPFLYANAAALTDITVGAGMGCQDGFEPDGYPALKGWDAVTGLGTPNYQALLRAALELPVGRERREIFV